MATRRTSSRRTRDGATRRGDARGGRSHPKIVERAPSASAQAPQPDPGSVAPPSSRASCPVVGVGASAGGIEALSKFLDRLAPDTGAAFVVVLHSDPNRKSYAVELYSRHTPMPVVEATDLRTPEPNHVYVAPAGACLTLEDGQLRVRPGETTRGHSIDSFLVTLAADRREEAVAVILSGSGSDGSLGVKSVKEHGGTTMAQSEGSAQHFEMPGSAIATGLVDVILPVEELPGRLAQYLRFEAPPIAAGDSAQAPGPSLAKVLELLRHRTGHDFSLYKHGTIGRRIQRRMQLLQIATLDAYLRHVRKHAPELDALHADLLIGVTRFFRDPSAFESLRTMALGPILDSKDGGQALKIWVAGCSTGEEAYSIALLVSEEMARRNLSLNVQIFATDLDPAHLAIARAGVYPAAIEADVSRERLARFFVRHAGGYQVVRPVREMLIFSVHNLLRDPPFSKLDLISCRNVLIYFRGELQKKVLPLFHYALRDRGFLFLGPSETLSGFSEYFGEVDAKSRLFVRKAGGPAPAPVFPVGRSDLAASSVPEQARPAPSLQRAVADLAERILLDYYAPAGLVIDANSNIVRFLGRTGKYMEPAPGAPATNLLASARRGLRTALRHAVHESMQREQAVVTRGVKVGTNGGTQLIDLVVRPLNEVGVPSRLWLVVFQDTTPQAHSVPSEVHEFKGSSEDPLLHQLEAELQHTRDDLKATIEDLEISNEELRSANEEYLSVNEELQSTVEELETSKEESQSINEELATVNSELATKVDQLAAAHSDLKNLLENTRIPTIFLDTDLKIRTFTGAITDIFALIPSDVGRPITDLKLKVGYEQLASDAAAVLRTLTPIQREARSPEGWFFDIRLVPYKTTEGKVTGVVIVAVDVTSHRRAAEEARRLATIVRDANDAIITVALDGSILTWNRGAERMYGYSADEAKTMNVSQLVPDTLREEALSNIGRLAGGEKVASFESRRVARDGRVVDVWLTATALLDESGRPLAVAMTDRDITHRRQQEQALRDSESRLRMALDAAKLGYFTHYLSTDELVLDERAHDILGGGASLGTIDAFLGRVHPDDLAPMRAIIGDARRGHPRGMGGIFEHRIVRPDGTTAWVSERFSTKKGPDGVPCCVNGLIEDISEHKRTQEKLREAYAEMGIQYEQRGTQLSHAMEKLQLELANRSRVERALKESQSRLSVIVSTAAEGIITIDRRGLIDSFNPAAERLFGYSAQEVIGAGVGVLMPPSQAVSHEQYVARYLKTGEKKVIGIGREVVGRRKDGTTFPMELAIGEGLDGDGPLFTGIVRDLTARKESDNILRTAERLAAIGTLAAGLGHDMNNVLLPVRAHLSALHAAGAAGSMRASERRHAEAIAKSVAYLQQLADGLHFLAMDPEKTDGMAVRTGLADWWAQSGALLTKAIPRHIKVSASIPPGLPGVRIAPHQLTQAMLNLLVNAGEAITAVPKRRAGHVHVWADVVADRKLGPHVRLAVTDNGKGMSDEEQRRAFEIFFTTKPRGLGTGLGLPLVRKVAVSAGGRVEIESKLNKGTTVSLILPPVAKSNKPGRGAAAARTAVVSVKDGRAAAMMRHMFVAKEWKCEIAAAPESADVWVVDPMIVHPNDAKAWRSKRPRGRIVLFGRPGARARASWNALGPTMIGDRDNFDAMRKAIGRVVGGS